MKRIAVWILITETFVLTCINKPILAEETKKSSILEKTGKAAEKVIEMPLKLIEGALGFDLGKLIVTPTKYETYLNDVTVSASVADSQDFKKGAFYDASEPLDRINSLRIERYGTPGQSSSPVIRGMTGSKVVVLIDGTPYNSPSLGEADISKIPLSKVERIEVVRGPYSSLYGADAVGGVINIITKDVPKKARMNTSYSFGSWNTHHVVIENGSTYGKLGYDIITDYISTGGQRRHADHNGLDITSKAKLDILDGIDYTFYTNYYFAKTEHPGARPAVLQRERTPTEQVLGSDDSASLFDYSRTNRVHLNSNLSVKNFTANHYFLYWNDDSHRETISFLNNIDRVVENDEFMTYIYGMEYKYVQPIMDMDTVTVGTTFDRKVFKVKEHAFNENTGVHTFAGRDAVRREWSIYGENEFKLYPFTVICGLRRDDPSDYSIRWSPKISGMVELGFGTKVRASYGRAYRAPTLNDINWPQDAFAEGNPNLRPEKTESWEIGVEKLFKDLILVRGTFFRQRIHDAIVWAPTGSLVDLGFFRYNRWTPTNLNRLSTKGVELETRFNILKCINLSLDYTYLDPVEIVEVATTPASESRRPAAYIPKHKFYGGLEWENPFNIQGLTLSSFLRFVSERRNYYNLPPEKKVLDHYFVLDAKGSYKYKNMEVFLAANNILDEGYDKFGSTVKDRGYPQPGLSFTGGVTVSY